MSTSIDTKEELFAVMEQIAAEREAARPIVEKLVASGESVEDIEIPEGWRTAGMVLEMCEFANARNESGPQLSLLLGQLALPIAINLASSTETALSKYLQARAWKEIGYANRYLCTYNAGERAYSNAEKVFSELGLDYEVARTQLPHAGLLFLAHQDQECLALNEAARKVFRQVADERQQIKCDVLAAMVLQQNGQSESARDRCEGVLRQLWDTEDLHTLGITYQCLGLAYRSLRQFSEAVAAFDRARQIFVAVDMPSEVNRADWGLGQVLLDRGEPHRALPMFERLREDYLKRNMPEEAGELGLWMVDALVAIGQTEWARELVERVLKEFTDARLQRNVITALSYLRDLMRISPNPIPAIRHVRTYVEKSHREPSLLFLPLDDTK